MMWNWPTSVTTFQSGRNGKLQLEEPVDDKQKASLSMSKLRLLMLCGHNQTADIEN
jgi:hypothetical protein